MPKIFEYLGIIVLFYSNEHEPIHVHGKYHNYETKAELVIENGKVVDIKFKEVSGKRPLSQSRLKDFKILVEKYKDDIVQR